MTEKDKKIVEILIINSNIVIVVFFCSENRKKVKLP